MSRHNIQEPWLICNYILSWVPVSQAWYPCPFPKDTPIYSLHRLSTSYHACSTRKRCFLAVYATLFPCSLFSLDVVCFLSPNISLFALWTWAMEMCMYASLAMWPRSVHLWRQYHLPPLLHLPRSLQEKPWCAKVVLSFARWSHHISAELHLASPRCIYACCVNIYINMVQFIIVVLFPSFLIISSFLSIPFSFLLFHVTLLVIARHRLNSFTLFLFQNNLWGGGGSSNTGQDSHSSPDSATGFNSTGLYCSSYSSIYAWNGNDGLWCWWSSPRSLGVCSFPEPKPLHV